MKNYYGEFKSFTTDKMAQSIENMSFAYNQTRAPKNIIKNCCLNPLRN